MAIIEHGSVIMIIIFKVTREAEDESDDQALLLATNFNSGPRRQLNYGHQTFLTFGYLHGLLQKYYYCVLSSLSLRQTGTLVHS